MMNTKRTLAFAALVLAVAVSRALPLHLSGLWNFTAIGGLAIFAGLKFSNKILAITTPILAMALSDLFIANGFNFSVYLAFALMVLVGFAFRKSSNLLGGIGSSVLGTVLFYLVTNFALLYPETLYAHTLSGVLTSYVAGLPFLANSLMSNLAFGLLFVYGFSAIENRVLATERVR